ncbi:hypothetical protein PRIPAC_85744 [Pristionchus pacificus]|uniref:Uncharacterized protein n=1 Tax=Pristionchus pacificus TaxID=54126 RepID=A0A2A6CCW1_PRIPA|nr:hypothetical protein PRIPAC_85744 [Pristionchus pacificus]|eukprot:PDM75930.1 hypothetical protein PRIPAC_43773 [Pristionchus pacificus]
MKANIKAHHFRVLLQAAGAKTSLKKAKASLSKGRSPMDAVLNKAGTLITSRSGMEDRVKEFCTNLFCSTTPVPRCSLPHSSDTSLPILPSEIRSAITKTALAVQTRYRDQCFDPDAHEYIPSSPLITLESERCPKQ